MSDGKPQPLFLEQDSYRQRRLRDVGRALPILGILLWLVPLLWAREGDNIATTGAAAQFIFGVWLILIVLTAIISSRIRPDPEDEKDTP